MFYWFFGGHEIFPGFFIGVIFDNSRDYEIFQPIFKGFKIYPAIDFGTKNCFLNVILYNNSGALSIFWSSKNKQSPFRTK